MNKLAAWIKSHQIAAFFIITFAITWGLGFSYIAVSKGTYLLLPAAFFATCGPALAGILITAITNTQPRQGKKQTHWIAFLVAWVMSALVFLAHNTFFNRAPFSLVMVGLVLVSVVPAAFVISMTYARNPAVKSYLASLIRLRGVWGWSLLALLCLPALALLSILINSLLGKQPVAAHQLPVSGLALIGLIVVKLVYQLFFFNATGEEVGWRGFALPRLQAHTSPLIASIVISLFWVPWHLFYFLGEGQSVLSVSYWLQTYLLHMPVSVIIGWLYNRSRGSILVAGIAHAAGNTALAFLPNLPVLVFFIAVYALALVMVVSDRMWKRLPSDHPAVYCERGE